MGLPAVRHRPGLASRFRVSVALAMLATSSAAGAQEAGAAAPAPQPGWAADGFVPAERGSRWFMVESLDLRGDGRMALGEVASYSYRTVAIRDANGDVQTSIVRNQLRLHTGASFVFLDRIRLGFDVPLQVLADGRASTVDGVVHPPAHDEAAVGDVRLSGDVRLFGMHGDGWTGAIGGQLFVPSGAAASFTGDEQPHLRSRFMVAFERGSWAFATMAGAHLRGRDEAYAGGRIGSELFVSVAGGLVLARGRIVVGPELQASTVVSAGAALRTRTTPVEALVGTRWEVLPHVRLGAALGGGLTSSFGAPQARALLSVEWTPDNPAPLPTKEDEKTSPPDRDGDGVPDADDACGFVPGSPSPFPERNGCPDVDRATPAPTPAEPAQLPPPEPAPAAPAEEGARP